MAGVLYPHAGEGDGGPTNINNPSGLGPGGGGGGAGDPAPLPLGETPEVGDTFVTDQSPAATGGVGAYDVWADQAFGGPTDMEEQLAQGAYGIASQQGPQWDQAYELMGAAGQRAVNPDPDNNLGNFMVGSQKMYQGEDPSSAALNPQLNQYLSMVGPNAGYDAATKAAIANEGYAALNAQEASARDQLANAQARTGSPLGAYGAIADVSQNIGNQRSAQARQNQILFGNEAQRQREAGAQGLGNVAQTTLGRENMAAQNWLAGQGQRNQQQIAAANQAQQFLNDATSRQLAGMGSAAGMAAQQRAYQQAGGAGLTNILQGQMGQQNQLYSMLASILGNKQSDASGVDTREYGANLDLSNLLGT